MVEGDGTDYEPTALPAELKAHDFSSSNNIEQMFYIVKLIPTKGCIFSF